MPEQCGEIVESRWGGGQNWKEKEFHDFVKFHYAKLLRHMEATGSPEEYEIIIGMEIRCIGPISEES